MKTITKKMLSVLMAVLVLLGGVWVSFKIEPAADDTEKQFIYTTDTDATKATETSNTETGSIDGATGFRGEFGYLVGGDGNNIKTLAGTLQRPYVVYDVIPGSAFSFDYAMRATAKAASENTAALNIKGGLGSDALKEFEFFVYGRKDAGSEWEYIGKTDSSALDYKGGNTSSYDTFGYGKNSITVPAGVNQIKVELPNSGAFTTATPTTYDYINVTGDYGGWNANSLGAFDTYNGINANCKLVGNSGSGLGVHYGDAQGSWGTKSFYLIYAVQPGSTFVATFKMQDAATRNNYAAKTGEPFEFVVSSCATWNGTYSNEATTAGQGTDGVIGYQVPAGCNYVKVTFPTKGIIPDYNYVANDTFFMTGVSFIPSNSWVTAGNDAAYIYNVKYATGVQEPVEYVYATDTDATKATETSNTETGSIDGATGFRGEFGYLVAGDGANIKTLAGTLQRPYVIYDVIPGSAFSFDYAMRATAKAASEATAALNIKGGLGNEALKEFEFFVYGRKDESSAWSLIGKTDSSALDYKGGNTSSYDTFGYGENSITVPANVNQIKVELPNSGAFTTATARSYDYTTISGDFGGWNGTSLGAFDNTNGINNSQFIVATSGKGLSNHWTHSQVAWGQANYYLIYKVQPNSTFVATFSMPDAATRNGYKDKTGEPFEFTVSACATWDGTYSNVATTAGQGTDGVIGYQVPAGCNYVKVTFPQKGIIPGLNYVANDNTYMTGVSFYNPGAWITAGNDAAYLYNVTYAKGTSTTPDTPDTPIAYDTTYDYSESKYSGNYGMWNNANIGANYITFSDVAGDVDDIIICKEGNGLRPSWGTLSNTWDTNKEYYIVYQVAGGTKFEATFEMHDAVTRQGYEAKTGEPFEFIIESSSSVDGTYGNEVTTAGLGTNAVVTYDVPADCEYVKITFPQKGVIPSTDYRGNDAATLVGVKMFKTAPETPDTPIAYDTTYDYSSTDYANDYGGWNYNALGAYDAYYGGNADYTLVKDTSKGIGLEPNWGKLEVTWGTADFYLIYHVAGGTKFEATFKMHDAATRNGYKGKTGEPFEFKIESSAANDSGWANAVTTEGKGTDAVITYDVPADCEYVKITFPQKGIIPTTDYRANDAAYLKGVKYFKYVAPVVPQPPQPSIPYDTTYDYSSSEYSGDYGGWNYDALGAETVNYNYFLVKGSASDPGLGGHWEQLGVTWGTADMYVIYKVAGGTKFEASFKMHDAATRAGYAEKTGEPFEFKIESSAAINGGWANAVTTAGQGSNAVITYDVPAGCSFVKITFPQKGIIPTTDYRANDAAYLKGVKFFEYVPYVGTYDTTYDYSDTTVETEGITGYNVADYGIYSYNSSVKAPSLVINENIWNDYRGGIGISFEDLGMPWGDVEKNYIIYEVKPGTDFEATIRMIGDKTSIANATGEPFEVTVEASSSDLGGWKDKVDTSSASNVAAGGYRDYTITYFVPDDCSYVKITFPQQGIIPGSKTEDNPGGSRGNDYARIMKVRLNAAKNYFEGTKNVMNYKANGAVNFFYDNDAALIYLYQKNGIVIENFSNGAAYVAPSMDYLNSGSNITKPYVVYAAEGGTKFVASFNVNRDTAAALGADFAMKFYESANGVNWTQAATQVESVGDVDYHTFTLAAGSKYVKIEYPHTDAVKGTDKVNEVYGLIKVGFNANESAYENSNPYGNYKFTHVDKFYGDKFSKEFNVMDYHIYENIGGVFNYETSFGEPYNHLTYTYINLYQNKGSDPCGLVYNVKPGTTFQAVVLTSRKNGDCQIVEKVTGKPFDIMVEVSSDGKTWSSYTPSRILTDDHLIELNAVSDPTRYYTEVITIPEVPSNVKFVKLVYPHTAKVEVMTNGVDDRAGNDFIGLVQVSLTKGDAVPTYLYDADRSKYEDIYDFTEDTYDLTALNPTGVIYEAHLGALTPSWGYFYGTNKAIREKCAVTVSVKEGSAFYLDFAFRPDRLKMFAGMDYDVKLLFSSDMVNWTDVTSKYVTYAPSFGDLNTSRRFEIDALPSGVKYVKVEYPHDHDMRGDMTAYGTVTDLLGNDNCGIKRIYFTADDHTNFEHEIQHGYYIEEFGDDFPENVTDDVAKVFGFYDYTKNAFKIHDYTDSEANDGRVAIKENYLYNKEKIDNPYIVYNVVPGTEFYMKVATSSGPSRLSIMPTARMKLFASETGEDGTWKEITKYFYSDVANNSMTQYYVNNVGEKTNFIKIVYPNDGDLVAQGKAEGTSGADFFTLKEVKATLVNYDPTWEETFEKVDFSKPDTDNNVDNNNVVVNAFNWLWVIIPAAAVLVLAAAAVVIFIIIKKKKSADQ